MSGPMTPERLAEIRQRDASGEFSLTTAADRRELLAFLDESLAHACILQAEADRLRAAVKFQRECNEDTGRIAERAEAEVDRLRAQMADAFDQGWIARAERDRPLTFPSLAVLAATPPPRSLNPYRVALAGDEVQP